MPDVVQNGTVYGQEAGQHGNRGHKLDDERMVAMCDWAEGEVSFETAMRIDPPPG